MSQATRSGNDALAKDESTWKARRAAILAAISVQPGSYALPFILRLLLFSIGLISGVLAWNAMHRTGSPEIGGVAFIAAGTLLVLLGTIGRFPKRLAGKGWEVEFSEEELSELLELIKREAPEIFSQVSQIVRHATSNPDIVDSAVRSAHASAEKEDSIEQKVLDSLAGIDVEEREVTVNVGSRGRPPVVDAVISADGRRYLMEIQSKWNSTAADLVFRRLSRALNDTNYEGAVLVVPAAHKLAALDQMADSDRILVVGIDEISNLKDTIKRHFFAPGRK